MVAVDTGSGFSNEIILAGNGNATWSFSDSNIFSVAYDGNNTAFPEFDQRVFIKITGIPNTVKRIRIAISNDTVADSG